MKIIRASDEETQQAFVLSLVMGAFHGAVEQDALAEFLCTNLEALGVLVLVCTDDGPVMRIVQRDALPLKRGIEVGQVLDAAHDAVVAAVDKVMADIGGTKNEPSYVA